MMMYKKDLCISNLGETKESQEKLRERPNFFSLILRKIPNNLWVHIF